MFMLSRAGRQRVSLPMCFMRRAFFFLFVRGACLFRHTCAAAAPRSGIAVSPEDGREQSFRSRGHPRDEQIGAEVDQHVVPGQVPPALFGKATPGYCFQQERLHWLGETEQSSPSGTSPTTTTTRQVITSSCRPSRRLRHCIFTCGKVLFVSAFLCQTALLRNFIENEATGMNTGVNREGGPPRPAVGTTLLETGTTLQPPAESQRFLSSTATTSAGPPETPPSWGPEEQASWIEEDHRRRMFATDEICRLRMLSMRRLTAFSWGNNTSNPTNSTSDGNTSMTMEEQEGDQGQAQGQAEDITSCLHDLEELSVLEEACIIDLLLEEGLDAGLPSTTSGAPARLLRSSVKDHEGPSDGGLRQPHSFLRPRGPGGGGRRTDGGEINDERKDDVEIEEVEALASRLAELELQPRPQQQDDTVVPRSSYPAGEFGGRRLGGPSEGGGGSSASGRACSEQELLELASRRCEVHRSEAQGLKWSGSLQAISKEVARDLQTWFTHQRLNLSDSGSPGSSRRLGVTQQRFEETVASIHELDQVLAKLRVVRLQVMGGEDLGLAVVAAAPFWNALPYLARCTLLRASTVCGICSLLYVLNLHKLTAYVVRRLRDSSSCATASLKEGQAEPRDGDEVNELQSNFFEEVGPCAQSNFFEEVGEEAAGAEVAQPSPAAALHRGIATGENKVGSGCPPSPRSPPPPTRQAQAASPQSFVASSSSGPSALVSSDEAAVAQEAEEDARSQESGKASSKESGVSHLFLPPSRTSTSSALFRQIPTSTSETGRNGYQGTESRALFQGEWQLQRLENFGEEYYPANNPKLHNLRRHMSGFQIFGDIMEDLWGGEPSELSFVHLRKLERRLLFIERISRFFAAAEGEDAAPDRALLPPCSAVEFDEVASSCGGCSWAASELLSERDEVCSSTTSAVCAAERLKRGEETPSSRASSPSIEEQDLETQINNGDDWLAARDDHLHDQRRKLKKEMVEPLVAFPDGEATNFLRGLTTTKGIYVMHLEKRSSSGLDGCSGRSKGSATAAGEAAQEDESCTPKDDELELVITRLLPGFGNAEVLEALTHAAGRAGGAAASGTPGSERRGGVRPPSTLPREVYRRTKGGGRFVPLLQRRT